MNENNDFNDDIIRGISCHLVSIDPILFKQAQYVDLSQDNSVDKLQAIIHKIYTEAGIENNLDRYLAGEVLPGPFIVEICGLGKKISDIVMRTSCISWEQVVWMSKKVIWGRNAVDEHHDGKVHLVDDIC